ncbi:kinase [Peribacillus simplex]|uniref:GHMP family kinase ATP-binding protein n=1 Tax=Peribacillus simplex TaxID=1478 RepID=UPI003D29CC7B
MKNSELVNTKEHGVGVSFGTFGELLQGVLKDDRAFLVTLPISKHSRAVFTPDSLKQKVDVYPKFKQKAVRLCETILKHYRLPLGGSLEIHSDLPIGKGLASSTADLVATSRAVEDAFGININITDLQSYLADIEPSDGVMYPGIVSFYHKEVQLKEYLGSCPPLTIVCLDEGGVVDTVKFNKVGIRYSAYQKKEYSLLLEQLTDAIKMNDIETVGKISTRSAMLHQKISPKNYLYKMIDINKKIKGLGVIIAHSGTYIGILLSSLDLNYEKKLSEATKLIKDISGEVSIMYSNYDMKSEVPYDPQYN